MLTWILEHHFIVLQKYQSAPDKPVYLTIVGEDFGANQLKLSAKPDECDVSSLPLHLPLKGDFLIELFFFQNTMLQPDGKTKAVSVPQFNLQNILNLRQVAAPPPPPNGAANPAKTPAATTPAGQP